MYEVPGPLKVTSTTLYLATFVLTLCSTRSLTSVQGYLSLFATESAPWNQLSATT